MDKKLKQKAINLRLKGKTYSEINKILRKNIPKSTLSEWFKKLTFSADQKKLLEDNIADKLKIAQLKAWKINKQRRRQYLNNLKVKNLPLLKYLNTDVQKLLLSILYLSEGAKTKSTQSLSLGSSNPEIIKLFLYLLKQNFHIDSSKFRARIQCRADQNKVALEDYWYKFTKIPKKQFYSTYIDKRTIGKPTLHKDYKGVCTIHYFSREIQFELEILANSVIKYICKGR